jgi:hypothetical protein
MVEEIIQFLIRSGYVWQSVEALKPTLPRWERHLREKGITSIPPLGSPASLSPGKARAHNELILLMSQSKPKEYRDPAFEHGQRNLTRIRPYKP